MGLRRRLHPRPLRTRNRDDEELRLPPRSPGTDWANGGTWVSAIAADGDGILVARNQVPFLVRLGPALTVTNTIDIPSSFAGATGLAVSGDHLFMTEGAINQIVARFSLAGVLEERFPSSADRLTPFGDGVVARHDLTPGSGASEILDADGSVVDVVAPPFTFPLIDTTVTNPLGVEVPIQDSRGSHVARGQRAGNELVSRAKRARLARVRCKPLAARGPLPGLELRLEERRPVGDDLRQVHLVLGVVRLEIAGLAGARGASSRPVIGAMKKSCRPNWNRTCAGDSPPACSIGSSGRIARR